MIDGHIINKLGDNCAKQVDIARFRALKAGTSVFFPVGLEDWEGGDDLVICPDANNGCFNCQACPCAEVHSRSECHQGLGEWEWGRDKESCGCPECDKLDQEQYDEIH